MQITTLGNGLVITIGWLIALLVLLVVIVLWVLHSIDGTEAALLAGLAVSRLL